MLLVCTTFVEDVFGALATLDIAGLPPTSEETRGFVFHVGHDGAFTAAERSDAWQGGTDLTDRAWAFVQLHPCNSSVVYGIVRGAHPPVRKIDVEHAAPRGTRCCAAAPAWARAIGRHGREWILQQHAFLVAAAWRDMGLHSASRGGEDSRARVHRALWVVYSAPRAQPPPYELRLHIQRGVDDEFVAVRVDRRGGRLDMRRWFVEDGMRSARTHARSRRIREEHWSCPLPTPAREHAGDILRGSRVDCNPSILWAARVAVARERRVHRIAAQMQHRSGATPTRGDRGAALTHDTQTYTSPPPLTRARQTELYALEQDWYRRQHRRARRHEYSATHM
ncbi:hypothetical protein MSPP1_001904 [Malassezia sp. CBS 17886]|nr:hypothetical protein MSPP1_001904 [Malassezia sp. CBS 17886]